MKSGLRTETGAQAVFDWSRRMAFKFIRQHTLPDS